MQIATGYLKNSKICADFTKDDKEGEDVDEIDWYTVLNKNKHE